VFSASHVGEGEVAGQVAGDDPAQRDEPHAGVGVRRRKRLQHVHATRKLGREELQQPAAKRKSAFHLRKRHDAGEEGKSRRLCGFHDVRIEAGAHGKGGTGTDTPQFREYLRRKRIEWKTRSVYPCYPHTFEVLSGTESTVSHFLMEQAMAHLDRFAERWRLRHLF